MMCEEIESWTFSGLVGAFLDIGIAYFLLCASTLAYFLSQFLGLFGMCLPCPCNGQFGNRKRNKCWQRALVDYPSENMSSVQFSVMSRFPFNKVWDGNLSSRSDIGVVNQRSCEHEGIVLEGEPSCSSFEERKSEMGVGNGGLHMRHRKEGRIDIKKGDSSPKTRNLRRRRNGGFFNSKFSSASSHDHCQSDKQTLPQSPASITEMMNEINEGSPIPASSGDWGESSMDNSFPGRVLHGYESNEPAEKTKSLEKAFTADFKGSGQKELFFGGDETNPVRVLERALEEQHAAHAALYLELEKERSAAATAADEAMAMILRLQEEKASIEMEARQYQRMIEEKSAYDFEEINILKEILVRREREKHFLEKEVEAYRQMIFGNEQLDSQDMGTTREKWSSLYLDEDPQLMLQRVTEYNNEMEIGENENTPSEGEVRSLESQNHSLASGKALPITELDEVNSSKQGFINNSPSIDKLHLHLSKEINEREKELASTDKLPFDRESEAKRVGAQSPFSLSTQECNLKENTVTATATGEVPQQSDGINVGQEVASKTITTCDPAKFTFPYNCHDTKKREKDLCSEECDASVSSIHDVHVIDDKLSVCSEVSEIGSKKMSVNTALDIPTTFDSPTMRRLETEQDSSRRSCPDMISGLPPIGCSRSKSSLSNLRRNSMSAVDYERFKIDNEVGWLTERLRIIQEGREKLNISMEHREKENIQLQLLENIVNQLREIRQLTEPGKADRRNSLPPPSCKVMSKKRRTVSLGVHGST